MVKHSVAACREENNWPESPLARRRIPGRLGLAGWTVLTTRGLFFSTVLVAMNCGKTKTTIGPSAMSFSRRFSTAMSYGDLNAQTALTIRLRDPLSRTAFLLG